MIAGYADSYNVDILLLIFFENKTKKATFSQF